MVLAVIVLFVAVAIARSRIASAVYILPPRDSGLNDHIQYAQTIGVMLGVMLFAVYLLVRKPKTMLVWLLASLVEFVLLVVSLIDRSIGYAPYLASNLATTWLQVLVAAPVLAGYTRLALRHNR